MLVLDTDAHQQGVGQQHEGEMAIPAQIATNFILIQSQIFRGLQVLFDAPASAHGLHDDGQRGGGQGGKDQVVGHLSRIVQAATKDQPMALVHRASVDQRQPGPIKEPQPFGAQALTESVPVLFVQCLLADTGHIVEQPPLRGLDADNLGARNGQGVGVALLLQEDAQVGAMSVDGISHHPANGQTSRLGTLHHAPSQFGFGLEADVRGEVNGLSAWQIVAPLFGQIQFAVDHGMSPGGHVGEKDAHLAIFDAPGGPAILPLDASRVAAPFGEAAFIHDEDGEERFRLSLSRPERRRVQGLLDTSAQLIAHAFFVPYGSREQPLHARGPWLSGVLSDLPAIFSGDLADDSSPIEPGVLAGFGASEVGSQALLPLAQGQGPCGDLLQRGSGWLCYDSVWRLHAFSLSDELVLQGVLSYRMLHQTEKIMKLFSLGFPS